MNSKWLQLLILATVAVIVAFTFGCEKRSTPEPADNRPLVVATTTMLEDMVMQLSGDLVVVRGLLSPGSDPHLYQPTPGDARTVASSDAVIRNGLFLEGWIDGLIQNAGGERPIITASENIEPVRMEGSPGGVDPHFWFDVNAWKNATTTVANSLKELVASRVGSEAVEIIDTRHQSYIDLLDKLDAWVKYQLATIPQHQRVLITSHDAFNYFERAYDIDVYAIQGISTEQEASQRDVANIIDIVRERNAPAVFVESSVNPSLIRQVARETGAQIVGPLYSDSIGVKGSSAQTYVGMVVQNVTMIVEGLGGRVQSFEVAQ